MRISFQKNRLMPFVALATVLLSSTAGESAAAPRPVASLTIGKSAFWTSRAGTHPSGDTLEFRINVSSRGASLLRVAVDAGSFGAVPRRLALIDPAGRERASAAPTWLSGEAFIDKPAAGVWIARTSWSGSGSFRMRARLEGAPKPKPRTPVKLLPNLRMIPPFEFTFTAPRIADAPYLPFGADPGRLPRSPSPAPNCSAYEVAEEKARRCLRFSLGPANAGPGPLQIFFRGTGSGLIIPAVASQRIYDTNGAWTEREAGQFQYHVTHRHYHHAGFGKLELYKVTDPKRGAMEKVGAGPKQGFCTADVMMHGWESFLQARQQMQSGCYNEPGNIGYNDPIGTDMAITAGWADLYSWSQDGNYVEFGDNGDGLYVVRGEADTANWIQETSEADNTSYAYIRVTGDDIDVLERGYGLGPWSPGKTPARDLLHATP